MTENRILVTGALGAIGRKLCHFLEEQYPKALIHRCDLKTLDDNFYIKGDIRNHSEMEYVFRVVEPDIVFHLAAEVGRYNSELYHPKCVDNNVMGALNIAMMCGEYGSKLVYTSTSEVYGENKAGGLGSKETDPICPINFYGLTKWQSEEVFNYYRKQYDLDVMIYRIFNAFGPGEYPNFYRSMVTNSIYDVLHNNKIHVHEGTARAWAYFDDVVRGLAIPMYDFRNDTYNLGTGYKELYSIRKLVETICEIAGKNPKKIIKMEQPGPFDVLIKFPNVNKMEKDFNFKCQWNTYDGLRKTIAWHKALYAGGWTKRKLLL
jgi:dTDP-glucose 4,6-dehydratase